MSSDLISPVASSSSVTTESSSIIYENVSDNKILNLNLSELLEKTSVGRAIKALYKIKRSLNSKCQSYLVEIIVQHFMNAVPFR